ncbi:hypothetical protein GCM10023317_72090 [Actinopolymorpha pittospori]
MLGRGTTVDPATGRAIEFQAFWTPDPRKDSSPKDVKPIASLKPEQSSHPQLFVEIPYSRTEDDGKPISLYKAVTNATLVEAGMRAYKIWENFISPALDEVRLPSPPTDRQLIFDLILMAAGLILISMSILLPRQPTPR